MSRACSVFALQLGSVLCLSAYRCPPWHGHRLISTLRFPLPSPPSRVTERRSRPWSKRQKKKRFLPAVATPSQTPLCLLEVAQRFQSFPCPLGLSAVPGRALLPALLTPPKTRASAPQAQGPRCQRCRTHQAIYSEETRLRIAQTE